jgi:hypothetical protein
VQARVATALQARDVATLQACNVIMLQLVSWQCCGVVATRVAGALRRCCSTCRSNAAVACVAAALLQQALRQCCIRQHCGAALARVAAALWRCCSPQQRRKAAHYATMASGSSVRGNGRQGYRATMAGGQHRNFCLFFFFYSTVSKRERRARLREKGQGFETCFPALLVGKLLPVNSLLQRQLPLAAAATSTLRRQQHTNTLR